VKLVEVSKWWF